MQLILCQSIIEGELRPLREYFSSEAIVRAASKAIQGLGKEIKGSKVPFTRLIKVSLTGERGAGRAVFLFMIQRSAITPVLLRLKKDKILGANVSMQNPSFVKIIEKRLNMIEDDIIKRRYDRIKL